MRKRSSLRKEAPANTSLSPEEKRRRAFQRAVKLLAAKPRSVAELRERLLEGRGATNTVVEEVIARLREYGYLDDERFAFGYASLRVKQKPLGRKRLERDLMLKKIAGKVAGEALDLVFKETSEEELIDRAIEKRVRLRGRPQSREDARKLFDHLLRQGFAFELVSERVRAVTRGDIDEDSY
ncbi:MAG TPA: RecX family transcriptional regulator [Pyrinomonadaceae bacterium]|nr:RecX family transcriptional regulator [Pyrinomonadaceae bacterium]